MKYAYLYNQVVLFEKLAYFSPETSAKILGVSVNSSFDEIKRAYYLLLKKYQADVSPDSADRFKIINVAKDILLRFKNQQIGNKVKPLTVEDTEISVKEQPNAVVEEKQQVHKYDSPWGDWYKPERDR